MDSDTTIIELKNKIRFFCEQRDWDQFHSPKELAIGISTEANELLQIFRFKTKEQMTVQLQDERIRSIISDELADVLFFVLRFAEKNKIDLSEALHRKMKSNEEKYPVEKAKGRNDKYNEY
ncbi:MAG: nucleotide pyrophosphohydrolase [Candidatus Merdousia sp.]|nr:nucleotide pyrophosphohydrolase [Candidatus Merdousia sp.]